MDSLIRKDISNIQAYQPGKPIAEVQRELGIKNVIKLASNENALGPSPKALKVIRKAACDIHRYPDGSCFYLKRKLARFCGIREKNLLLGNGSDELIDIILKTVREENAEILTSELTFVDYKICGAINGFKTVSVPVKDYTYDLNGLRRAITKRTKVIFIANPNNPTGTYVTSKQVASFLDAIAQNILVVFDEAYVEYVSNKDFPKLLPMINKKNIALLRTFSKIYGLAGLRIGYMIAGEDFIAAAQRVRPPFNVNSLAQAAAEAALEDQGFVRKSKKLVKKEKTYLSNEFLKLGIWFKESAANFIFVRFNTDVARAYRALLAKGVIIRDMSSYGLNRYARITIGTRQENKRLVRALKDVLS
ncbi:MAG: histidinol-phosphate transaminase [Candidatus Omnitrophota bacterium]